MFAMHKTLIEIFIFRQMNFFLQKLLFDLPPSARSVILLVFGKTQNDKIDGIRV